MVYRVHGFDVVHSIYAYHLFVRMTDDKLQTYLQIARSVGSDEFYQIIFSTIPCANNLPEAFSEGEVVRFLRMSPYSNDRKLEMISVWAESNTSLFNKADSTLVVFNRFLRHIDVTKLSNSAVNRFLLGETLFSLNRDCR